MKTVTDQSELANKIEQGRYRYFTLPTLDITVKYRKPDLMKLSFKKQLPGIIADMVLKSYKALLNGKDPKDIESDLGNQDVEITEETMLELSEKGFPLMKELVVSHLILDVPESDTENNIISWHDVPEEDAMAFLMNLVQEAQKSKTAEGGEVTSDEVADFPVRRRVGKRDTTGQSM